MNTINNYENLFNNFIELFNQIKEIPETSIFNIEEIIQYKIMKLGKIFIEAWFSETLEIKREETRVKISNTEYIYNGMVNKTFITILGDITIKRAYYYNVEKKSGVYPIEEKYNFLKDVCFPEVKERICYTSCIEPYGKANEVLEKLSGIKVSTSEIQKIQTEIEYFIKNTNRMQYEYFESLDFPIGSGII